MNSNHKGIKKRKEICTYNYSTSVAKYSGLTLKYYGINTYKKLFHDV